MDEYGKDNYNTMWKHYPHYGMRTSTLFQLRATKLVSGVKDLGYDILRQLKIRILISDDTRVT